MIYLGEFIILIGRNFHILILHNVKITFKYIKSITFLFLFDVTKYFTARNFRNKYIHVVKLIWNTVLATSKSVLFVMLTPVRDRQKISQIYE